MKIGKLFFATESSLEEILNAVLLESRFDAIIGFDELNHLSCFSDRLEENGRQATALPRHQSSSREKSEELLLQKAIEHNGRKLSFVTIPQKPFSLSEMKFIPSVKKQIIEPFLSLVNSDSEILFIASKENKILIEALEISLCVAHPDLVYSQSIDFNSSFSFSLFPENKRNTEEYDYQLYEWNYVSAVTTTSIKDDSPLLTGEQLENRIDSFIERLVVSLRLDDRFLSQVLFSVFCILFIH
jgi:hypothetical protein